MKNCIGLFPDNEEIRYMANSWVQATMPHSKPKETSFIRQNGFTTFTMLAHPKYGLPYGTIPRLLMAWITTEAVKTRNPVLSLGDSLSSFMRELGLIPAGGRWGTISRLKDQMKRLFTTTIWIVKDTEPNFKPENYTPVDSADLWWDTKTPDQIMLFNSVLTLQQKFFEEIIKKPVVFRLSTLKALKQSSLAVDIYIWITYRNSYASKPFPIKWEELQLQFGAGYPMTNRGKLDFKKKFLATLKKVAEEYPEAGKLRTIDDKLLFVPGRPDVPKLYIVSKNSSD